MSPRIDRKKKKNEVRPEGIQPSQNRVKAGCPEHSGVERVNDIFRSIFLVFAFFLSSVLFRHFSLYMSMFEHDNWDK